MKYQVNIEFARFADTGIFARRFNCSNESSGKKTKCYFRLQNEPDK